MKRSGFILCVTLTIGCGGATTPEVPPLIDGVGRVFLRGVVVDGGRVGVPDLPVGAFVQFDCDDSNTLGPKIVDTTATDGSFGALFGVPFLFGFTGCVYVQVIPSGGVPVFSDTFQVDFKLGVHDTVDFAPMTVGN